MDVIAKRRGEVITTEENGKVETIELADNEVCHVTKSINAHYLRLATFLHICQSKLRQLHYQEKASLVHFQYQGHPHTLIILHNNK
jgi:hypothetical protein